MTNIFQRMRFIILALAAALLVACGGTPRQASTGELIDDSVITTKVKSALLADKDVSGLAIGVETFKGTVQLSGFAKTEHERAKAAQVAGSVKGVQTVKNDILIK